MFIFALTLARLAGEKLARVNVNTTNTERNIMDNNEKIIFNNSFGTVSDKRVIVNYKNGSEDIPIKQISSVGIERKQNIFLAIIYFVIGIGVLVGIFNMREVPGAMIVVALVFFLFCVLVGVAYYIGNHQIKLSTAGVERKPIKVEMSKTREGREFSNAIKKQIISN